jgi:hypothetical protein
MHGYLYIYAKEKHIIMIKFIAILSLPFILASCSMPGNRLPKEHVMGGPCSYDSSHFETRVIAVTPDISTPADSVYIVVVKTFGKPYHEPLTLNAMTEKTLTSQFIKSHNIVVGTVVTGTLLTETKGTCSPLIYKISSPNMK